ncbi:hypothetical protein XENOCAPTIV_000033, partial [Xenoophorus captivus]
DSEEEWVEAHTQPVKAWKVQSKASEDGLSPAQNIQVCLVQCPQFPQLLEPDVLTQALTFSLSGNSIFFFSDCVSISKRDEWMTFDFLAMKTTSTAERRAEKDRQKEDERAKAQAIEQVPIVTVLMGWLHFLVVKREHKPKVFETEEYGFVFAEICKSKGLNSVLLFSLVSFRIDYTQLYVAGLLNLVLILPGWFAQTGAEPVLERWRNWFTSRGPSSNCSKER